MLLSREKAAIPQSPAGGSLTSADRDQSNEVKPTVEAFFALRDYQGALTLIDFESRVKGQSEPSSEALKWKALAHIRLMQYQEAMKIYETLVEKPDCDPSVYCYLAACYFFLGLYRKAEEAVQRAPHSSLQNRVQFHLAQKQHDEQRLLTHHRALEFESIEDQLALAAMHYLRAHYQEAADIYKNQYKSNRKFIALNVYIALCYYKLDYYDVSEEVLASYLQAHPDSPIALNLRACNYFRQYDGRGAEKELKNIKNPQGNMSALVKHNQVVFRNGEGALQVFPPLVGVLPEARLNLAIHHLRNGEIAEAHQLMRDVEPAQSPEYILKAIVHLLLGQMEQSKEHMKTAQQYYQVVGQSATECDTIPGRQCMASCYMLLKQWDDVLLYLQSIKAYFMNDDTFNFNYGQVLGKKGKWEEAEEAFLQIRSEKILSDFTFISWLTKCFIMNGKPSQAWENYLKTDSNSGTFTILSMIATDCYITGQFYYAAKAFDVLERLDPNPEYWEGKRGACIGWFQRIIAGKEPKDSLTDLILMLRNTNNREVDFLVLTINKWAKENNAHIEY